MNNLIIEEVNYYIENDVTKKDVASYFNRSLSSVKKDFSKFIKYVEENPDCKYYDLYLRVISKARVNEQLGKVKGGKSNNSGKKRLLTIKETLKIARYIVYNNLTLRDAEQELGISRSTIYDSIEQLKNSSDDEIKDIYYEVQANYASNKANAVYNINENINTNDGNVK